MNDTEDTERLVCDYLTLIAPLVPVGRVAVVITGVPRRTSHMRLYNAVARHAARYKTHRSNGIAKLYLHFGPGAPSTDGSTLSLNIDIGDDAKKTRMVRMISLLVMLFVVWQLAG